jgi:tetratricopeptide (TPR) repeat protein
LPQPEPAAVVTNEPARDPFVDALAILKRIDPVHAAMRRGQTASLVAMLSLPEEVDAAGAESRAQEVRTRRLLEQSQAWMNEGRHDEAIGLVENALERAASSRTRFSLLQCLASYNFQIRRYAEALRHMQAIDRISPGRLSTQCSLAGILMSMDRHDEALEILTKITLADIRDRTLMFAVCFNLACTHSLKGNRQRAMEYLVVAFKTDPLATMASLGDPQLDNIRDEVLFKELSMKRSSLDFSEEIAPSSFTLGTQDAPTNDVLDVALVLEQLRLQQRVTSGHSGPIELRGLSLRGEGGASEPGSRLGL